jgi:hypothetical protein
MSGTSGHPRFHISQIVLAFVVGVTIGACGFRVEGQGTPPSLRAVLADASSRAGADGRNVQILRMERIEWPDTGLGCPRPGELHAQVVTPGWLIEVRSGGKVFEYHTDADDNFALCAER